MVDISKEEMILFLKLFSIMGLTWIVEIIHVLIHGDHDDHTVYYSEVRFCSLFELTSARMLITLRGRDPVWVNTIQADSAAYHLLRTFRPFIKLSFNLEN